jgi:hypothetical protein
MGKKIEIIILNQYMANEIAKAVGNSPGKEGITSEQRQDHKCKASDNAKVKEARKHRKTSKY